MLQSDIFIINKHTQQVYGPDSNLLSFMTIINYKLCCILRVITGLSNEN